MIQSQLPAQVKKPILKKVAIVMFAIWFLLYLCIWAFSPVMVRYFAMQPLTDMNLQLHGESSIRFNPFTSTLSLDNLMVLDANNKQVFSLAEGEISIQLHRLFLLQLYVSEFNVSRVMVDVVKQNGNLYVAGIDLNASATSTKETPEPISTSEPSPFDIILPEFILSNIVINAKIDSIAQTVILNKLSIVDLFVNQQYQSLQLALTAHINEAPFTFETTIALEDKIGDISTNISLSDFSLASISPLLSEQAVEVSGFLSLRATPTISLGAETINVDDKKLSVELSDLFVSAQSMLIEGKNHTFVAENLAIIARTNGNLQSASVNVTTELMQGKVGIVTHENNLLNWASITALTQIQIDTDENGELIPNIIMPNITFDTLHLSEDLSLEAPAPMLALGKLNIDALKFANNQLVIDKIQIAEFNANVQVNGDKSIQSLVDTSALMSIAPAKPITETEITAEQTQQEVMSEKTRAPLTIVLNTFELIDKGIIKVKDETVTPVFIQELEIETLIASSFDSSKPNTQSPFELLVIDNNYLKIDAKGHITPFTEQLNAQVIAKVSELNLPSVSPYIKEGLGFEMKTGQLDVTIEINIKNDEIDGNTKLFIRGIEMAKGNEIEQSSIKEGKAMPLNVALGILKNGDGNIDLDVPIRGNIASPSFGIESFVTLIIKKAVMSQAKDYLMNTFVPYASVVSIAMSGAEYLLKISFEPLIFNTAETGLKVDNAQFLSELALLMQDTPDLQIKTCAIVTYSDLNISENSVLNEQQKSQLKSIGDDRQANLKRFLVDKGLASNRVLYCAPELDTTTGAVPRIELKTD